MGCLVDVFDSDTYTGTSATELRARCPRYGESDEALIEPQLRFSETKKLVDEKIDARIAKHFVDERRPLKSRETLFMFDDAGDTSVVRAYYDSGW